MNLIPQATLAAAQVDSINRETASFVRAQLARAYALVFNSGDPQPVLDALGTKSVAALTNYVTLYTALTSLGLAGDLAEPILTIYVPNADGTVTYVPAPIPTPEPPVEDPQPDPPLEPTPEP